MFTELKKLKTDLIILPVLPDIPTLSDKDFPDDIAMSNLVSRTSIAEDDPEASVPTDVAASSARRNLTSVLNEDAVTRTRARQVTYADVDHRNDDTTEERKINLEEFIDYLLVLNVSLESDPKQCVPKNYKELIKSKDKSG